VYGLVAGHGISNESCDASSTVDAQAAMTFVAAIERSFCTAST
jgi:hypothetical protein